MTLEPTLAAQLADAVYGIRTTDNVARGIAERGVTGLDGVFNISDGTVAHGTSGAGPLHSRTGFAMVLAGTGARSGERVVAIRGTATQYDWLSNLNTAVERGPGGQLVHAGFHRVSQTIVGVISTALRGTNPSKLHVVGHSLGGAVANLIAARLHVDRVADIELYTFGAPRAGLGYFASGLTRDLSARQIHRVYNLSDAVPMVPLHPLRHAPAPGDGVRVRTPHGLVSIDAHLMRAYTSAVSNQTWPQLSVASRDLEDLLTVDHWIQRATENTRFPGSSYALYALGWALKGLLDMARDQLGAAIVAHMTLLDRLAWLLHRAAEASLALGERLLALMRAVLRFAGRTLAAGATLSAAFISYVLGLLIRPLAAIAHMALERVAMEG